MYESSNNARIQEKIQNAELVKNLFEEKNKLEAKHTTLLSDVKQFMFAMEKRVLQENMRKIKEECEDQTGIELGKMEKEKNLLLEEKKNWEEEKKQLKEEKKRLEYMLFDLLKACDAFKEKMKKIKNYMINDEHVWLI